MFQNNIQQANEQLQELGVKRSKHVKFRWELPLANLFPILGNNVTLEVFINTLKTLHVTSLAIVIDNTPWPTNGVQWEIFFNSMHASRVTSLFLNFNHQFNGITNIQLILFGLYLQKSHITSLHINNHFIYSYHQLKIVCHILNNSPNITSLDLDYDMRGDNENEIRKKYNSLHKLVVNNPTIISLGIHYNNFLPMITTPQLIAIGYLILQKKIHSLDLSEISLDKLNDDTFATLCGILQGNPHITQLKLFRCGLIDLADNRWVALCDAVRKSKITWLDLSDNGLDKWPLKKKYALTKILNPPQDNSRYQRVPMEKYMDEYIALFMNKKVLDVLFALDEAVDALIKKIEQGKVDNQIYSALKIALMPLTMGLPMYGGAMLKFITLQPTTRTALAMHLIPYARSTPAPARISILGLDRDVFTNAYLALTSWFNTSQPTHLPNEMICSILSFLIQNPNNLPVTKLVANKIMQGLPKDVLISHYNQQAPLLQQIGIFSPWKKESKSTEDLTTEMKNWAIENKDKAATKTLNKFFSVV